MSDARLREIEREAAAGDCEAQARLLREKVRAGLIDQEKVELLAYLFWPPAWEVLGWKPHGFSGSAGESSRARLFLREGQEGLYEIFQRFGRWAPGLRRWGSEAAVRVGIAAVRSHQPLWEAQYDRVAKAFVMPCPKERVLALLLNVELFLFGSSAEQAQPHALRHEGFLFFGERHGGLARGFGDLEIATDCVQLTPAAFGQLGVFAGTGSYDHLVKALEGACDLRPMAYDSWGALVTRRNEAVYEAIRRELVPWALGSRDPVAERELEDN